MKITTIASIKTSLGKKLTLTERILSHDKLEPIVDAYYWILGTIERLKRSYDYAKFGYNNYDFDAQSIENYLAFKLPRIQKCLINGHCDLTVESGPIKMKALRLMIKLSNKLISNDYNRFSNMHSAKWGELKTWFEPTERNDGSSYWRSSRPKADTPELIEQERNESREAYYADARHEARDRQLLYQLLNKYITYLWD